MRLRRGDDAGRGEKATLALCAYACVNTCSVYAFFLMMSLGCAGNWEDFRRPLGGTTTNEGERFEATLFPKGAVITRRRPMSVGASRPYLAFICVDACWHRVASIFPRPLAHLTLLLFILKS